MPGTFTVEWLPGGILLQRRAGQFSVEEAKEYAAAVERAIASHPTPWGLVVDGRDAGVQVEQVQDIIQQIIQFVVSQGVARVAMVVASSAVTGMQQRRLTTSPGMHDAGTIGFFTDYDEAVADVTQALAAR